MEVRDIRAEMGLNITLHMDPIVTDDEQVNRARALADEVIKGLDPSLSMHDFRMVSGPYHTNLIFDVVVPFSVKTGDREITEEISRRVAQQKSNYYCVITVDRSYQ